MRFWNTLANQWGDAMFKSLPILAATAVLVLQQQPTEPPASGGQIAVGVLIAIYVLEKAVPLVVRLLGKNGKSRGEPPQLARIASQVDDLHEWHKARDSTGAFLWYKGPETARMVALLEEIRDLARDAARRS